MKTVFMKEVKGNVFDVEGDSSRLQVWCFVFVFKVLTPLASVAC